MSATSSLVSVVLPTHNGSKYLADSIRSCLGQTYADIELIIVDDGSTDATPDVIASLDDSRISGLRHDANRGLPASLNTGFARARGDYLTWTSDDNLYAPHALETMVSFLHEHPDVDFVYADCWLIDEHGRVVGIRHVESPESSGGENRVGACFLYRRRVYETLGEYNPAARLAEDYEYWLRVSRGFVMTVLREPLYYYRVHGDSLSGRLGGHASARVVKRVAREYGVLSTAEYRRSMSRLDVDEAFLRFKQGDLARARALLVRGLMADPGWLRNRGVISILLRSVGLKRRRASSSA